MTTSHAAGPAVRTEALWKVHPQQPTPVQAVRGVTLEIARGDFVALASQHDLNELLAMVHARELKVVRLTVP